MSDWITFENGLYGVSTAFLVSPMHHSVSLEDTLIDIYTGRGGRKQMRGRAMVRNILLVDLLEDGDPLDLYLDFGESFRFLMRDPMLQAGKVFSPNIKSIVHIYPRYPWDSLSDPKFEEIAEKVEFLSL